MLSEWIRFRNEVIRNIGAFSKRPAIRNFKTHCRFSKEQAGLIYDVLYKAMCIVPPSSTNDMCMRSLRR